MLAEQPVGLPRSEAQIVGGDLEQFVVEQQSADVELGMAPRSCGDHQLRGLTIDEATELGFSERRCDHVEVVDDQRDPLAGPVLDAGREGRDRRAVELDADRPADDPSDLGKTSVRRGLEQISGAPSDRRCPSAKWRKRRGLAGAGGRDDEGQAKLPQLVDERVDALAREGAARSTTRAPGSRRDSHRRPFSLRDLGPGPQRS